MSLIYLNNNIRVIANTPQEEIVWELAATFGISKIERLYYLGAIPGSEFQTYSITKMYIALQFDANASSPDQVVQYGLGFWDHANTDQYYNTNVTGYDILGTVHYVHSYFKLKYFLFSKISHVANAYDQMQFIGYRLTVTL